MEEEKRIYKRGTRADTRAKENKQKGKGRIRTRERKEAESRSEKGEVGET